MFPPRSLLRFNLFGNQVLHPGYAPKKMGSNFSGQQAGIAGPAQKQIPNPGTDRIWPPIWLRGRYISAAELRRGGLAVILASR